jgi:hypothetical protein
MQNKPSMMMIMKPEGATADDVPFFQFDFFCGLDPNRHFSKIRLKFHAPCLRHLVSSFTSVRRLGSWLVYSVTVLDRRLSVCRLSVSKNPKCLIIQNPQARVPRAEGKTPAATTMTMRRHHNDETMRTVQDGARQITND